LPLQNVNSEGELQVVEDMVDLPFLHEVCELKKMICVFFVADAAVLEFGSAISLHLSSLRLSDCFIRPPFYII
jgi:hypothetical protein